MSDSSRAQLQFSPETVFNEVPSSPVMQKLRFTRETIAHKNSTVTSAEIRADRMRNDLLLIGIDVAGTIDADLTYGSFDQLIEAALCGAWSTTGNATFADGVTTSGSAIVTSATAAFVVGDIGKPISGAGIPANSTITAINSGTSVTISQNATATGSAISITITARSAGNVLKNGVVNRSFLFEKGFLDVGQFFQFRGCAVESFDFDVSARKVVSANFNIMGAQASRSASTVAGTSNAVTTSPTIVAGPQVSGVSANTPLVGVKIRSLKFSVKNNLRIHDHVESLASDDFGRGVQDLTGSMDVFFKNGLIYDQFLTNGSISFSFVVTDPATNRAYTFLIPKLKLPDVNQEIAGVDADVMQTIQFRGLYDPTTGAHLQITRT